MTEYKPRSGDERYWQRICPVSRKDQNLKSGRRCEIDGKPCHTPYLWLYDICDVAKEHREGHKGLEVFM